MHKLELIEGIGKTYASKLHQQGIDYEEQLLNRCSSRRDRELLAKRSGISEKLLLKWVNRADLDRINGISEEYADLLEHAGVDTVPELAMRNPENLHEKIHEINLKKHLVRRMPSLNQIETWIMQAKKLPRVIKY